MYVKCTWDADLTRRWKGRKELLSIHISSLLVPITCFCPEYRVYPISITQLLQTLLFHFTNGEIIASLIRKIALKMSLSVWRSSHPERRSQHVALLQGAPQTRPAPLTHVGSTAVCFAFSMGGHCFSLHFAIFFPNSGLPIPLQQYESNLWGLFQCLVEAAIKVRSSFSYTALKSTENLKIWGNFLGKKKKQTGKSGWIWFSNEKSKKKITKI